MADQLVEAAGWALRHFAALDEANAAIHTAPVRYSPITFRFAEALVPHKADSTRLVQLAVGVVLGHKGQYEEDTGR